MEELDTTIHHMDTSSLEVERPSMISMLTAKDAVTSTPRKIEKVSKELTNLLKLYLESFNASSFT